jgi:glycosyltransferase involved in cell wall biosynthesis
MKILSILTYYHPHWTGLTAIATRIAEGLAARGHEMTVLTTQHDAALAREERLNGVRVIRVRPIGRVSRGMLAPAFPWVAARLIAEQDVVQIHTPLPECALVALVCRARRRPLLMTHQGDLVMPAGVRNQLIQKIGDTVLGLAARLAKRITAHSSDYVRHSKFLGPWVEKTVAIHPPVDIPEVDPDAVASWRGELGLEGKSLVGFAGRFVEEKGFDYLLRAIPAIVAAKPNAHFVFAGEHRIVYESFYEVCRPLIEANRRHLTFVGLLRERQRLADFYGMCDVFVLPSRTDCFAAVQVEALLSGTPVVAFDIPGAREVVLKTGMGRLVASRDSEALAEGIVGVLRYGAPQIMSRSDVRAVFDPERSIDSYEALLAELSAA